MIDVKKEIRTLHQDAIYFNLMKEGYTNNQVELKVEKMLKKIKNENVIKK